MPCFCNLSAEAVNTFVSPQIGIAFPAVPLSMKLAVALPAMEAHERLDLQIDAHMAGLRLPTFTMPSGGLMDVALALSMISGTFTLDNIPALELEMQQAADSITNNLWPITGWLTSLSMPKLLNLALMARLVLDLTEMGIDPFALEMPPPVPLNATYVRFGLTRPRLEMARFYAGLPTLVSLAATFDIPPIGDTGSISGLGASLNGLASISPPKLGISLPTLSKLAMTLNALATIKAAFGEDALMPSGLERIRFMFKLWSRFPLQIPFPMPALALKAKLDMLPTLEDIQLGETLAGPAASEFGLHGAFSPPKIAIMPVLSLMLALSASMQLALEMDPLDMCSMCPFS